MQQAFLKFKIKPKAQKNQQFEKPEPPVATQQYQETTVLQKNYRSLLPKAD